MLCLLDVDLGVEDLVSQYDRRLGSALNQPKAQNRKTQHTQHRGPTQDRPRPPARPQQTRHPVRQLPTGCGQRRDRCPQPWCMRRFEGDGLSQLGHRVQGLGNSDAVARDLCRHRVAAGLALLPDLPVHPVQTGVKKQHATEQPLNQINHRVPPPDMGQFMGQDHFELARREPHHHRGRQQDHRLKHTHHAGHCAAGLLQHHHRSAKPQAITHLVGKPGHRILHRSGTCRELRTPRPIAHHRPHHQQPRHHQPSQHHPTRPWEMFSQAR